MLTLHNLIYWLNVLVTISQSLVVSYNQPWFSPCASWNLYATTLTNVSTIGTTPYGLFIDRNNSVYVAERKKNRAQVWIEGAVSPTNTFSGNLSEPAGIFVTITGDVYVDDGKNHKQVQMWPYNRTDSVTVMNVINRCHSLFVNTNNTLYCCMGDNHQVVKQTLSSNVRTLPTIIAGNGTAGSTAHLLSSPNGIFVTTNFALYVADGGNDRIQLFLAGQSNGSTVLGNGSTIDFPIKAPTAVTLDANGYLFIVDSGNHRIVGSGPYGFRCVVGCSGTNGSAADKLSSPFALAFDSYGSIFVTDSGNARVQKFVPVNDSCIPSSTERAAVLSSAAHADDSTIGELMTTETNTISKTTVSTATTELNEDSTVFLQATTTESSSTDQRETIGTTTVVISESHSIDEHTSTTTATPVSFTSKNIFFLDTESSISFITTTPPKPTFFNVPICTTPNTIGSSCNVSNESCNTLNPCQNAGTCHNNINASSGYSCLCMNGVTGDNCQFDNRPCKAITCWNNGSCATLNSTNFLCECAAGWAGLHCERKIDYCSNITCQNNGVCRPLLLSYQCECLTSSFSGRHCEKQANNLIIKEIASRTLAYVAILVICSVVLFIITLDVLKYGFNIDPVLDELKRSQKKQSPRRPKPPVVIRFSYVN